MRFFSKYEKILSLEELKCDRDNAQRAYEHFFKIPGDREQREILICHGNIIRYFLSRVMNAPPDIWTSMDIRNGSVSEVAVTEGRLRVTAVSGVGHIPPSLWM